MLFPVRTEGGSTGSDGDFLAVVIVKGSAGQNVICFRVAVMFVNTDGAKGRNDDLGVHVAFAVQLSRRQ